MVDEGPAYARLATGSTFARFAIESAIGDGPTGTVYRVRDARLGLVRALKVMAPRLGRDAEFRGRFGSELRTVATLEHEHVLTVYDVGDEAGLLYVAMRFVDGEDLASLLAREASLPPASVVAILAPVAEALEAAHRRALVHGNVKPHNILIGRDPAQIYLTDFGLGRALGGAPARSSSRERYDVADYLAPEQLLGEPIDARTDVYALGVILRHAVSGAEASNALERVIRTATASAADERYQTAAEFLEALLAAASPEPVVRATGDGPAAAVALGPDELTEAGAAVLDDDVQFTVYRPHRVLPARWYPLLAFAHKSEPFVDEVLGPVDPLEEVRNEAAAALGDKLDQYIATSDDSSQELPRGSALTFVPDIEGVEFNPASRSFQWLEPVHREEFRMRASQRLEGRRARGRLSVYFGSILIAEVSLSIRVGGADGEPGAGPERAKPYRRIFVSYSHSDTAVVEQVETFLSVVGDEFLRDSRDLRAGEVWEDRIAEMIKSADIFQLFWSSNSMRSGFVEQEWRYALSLGRPNFVRPTFWEQPMPALPELDLPPDDLRRLHFRYLPGVLRALADAPPPAITAKSAPVVESEAEIEREHAPERPGAKFASPVRVAPSQREPARRSMRVRGIAILVPVLAALGITIPVVASIGSSGAGSAYTTGAATPTSGTPPSTVPTEPSRPFVCGAGTCYAGHGPASLGAVTASTGATLSWLTAGGRFVLTLDGLVAVNSTAHAGRVRLTQSRYDDVSVATPGRWIVAIGRR